METSACCLQARPLTCVRKAAKNTGEELPQRNDKKKKKPERKFSNKWKEEKREKVKGVGLTPGWRSRRKSGRKRGRGLGSIKKEKQMETDSGLGYFSSESQFCPRWTL